MTINDSNLDSRWICYLCADLDWLNEDGLCRQCAPEPVAEFVEIAMRVVAGEPPVVERQWRIG